MRLLNWGGAVSESHPEQTPGAYFNIFPNLGFGGFG